jgi:hypothetical protein
MRIKRKTNAPILIINKINNKDQEHSDRKAE